VPRARFNATRAISIARPQQDVWPWIVQLGYRRAGFYTYDLVDNAGERSADRIIDAYQDVKVGDLIRCSTSRTGSLSPTGSTRSR
jgi:hypothetical protein